MGKIKKKAQLETNLMYSSSFRQGMRSTIDVAIHNVQHVKHSLLTTSLDYVVFKGKDHCNLNWKGLALSSPVPTTKLCFHIDIGNISAMCF